MLSLIIGVIVLYFIPQTQEYVIDSAFQTWLGLIWLYEELLTSYSFPLWLFLSICILASVTIIKFILTLQGDSKPEHISYVEDIIYDAKWRWKWTKDEVSDIQCYCPKCDAMLIYDDRSSHTRYTDVSKTDFICQNCDSQLVASIHGGNKNYALSAVKREIERRIRTNEYKSENQTN